MKKRFLAIGLAFVMLFSIVGVAGCGNCENYTHAPQGELITLASAYSNQYLSRKDIKSITYTIGNGVVYEFQNGYEIRLDFKLPENINLELDNSIITDIKQLWREMYRIDENHTDLSSITVQFFGWHNDNAVVLIRDSIPFFSPEAGWDIISNIVFNFSHQSNPFRVWRKIS